MWLIVGLGNPGSQYAQTRHNAGWVALDKIATVCRAADWRADKSGALITQCMIGDHKIMLVKPQAFMNLSGVATQQIASYYKVPPANIIVLHDDMDFAIGALKVQFDRSGAGHNGVLDIIEKLGTQAFHRVRIGIGPKVGDGADFVLQKFSTGELSTLREALDKITECVTGVITRAA